MKRNLLCGKIRTEDISKIKFLSASDEGKRITIVLAPPKMERNQVVIIICKICSWPHPFTRPPIPVPVQQPRRTETYRHTSSMDVIAHVQAFRRRDLIGGPIHLPFHLLLSHVFCFFGAAESQPICIIPSP